jgi:hypothetical protein
MTAARVFTLSTGGWLVVGANGKTTIVSPLPTMTGQPAAQLAQALRDWADDIERAATERATCGPAMHVRVVDLITGEIEEGTLANLYEAYSLGEEERAACESALKDFGAWRFGNAADGRKRVEVMP